MEGRGGFIMSLNDINDDDDCDCPDDRGDVVVLHRNLDLRILR